MPLSPEQEQELARLKVYVDEPPDVPLNQVMLRHSAYLSWPISTDEVLRQGLVYAIGRFRDKMDEFARLLRMAQFQYGDKINVQPLRIRHRYLVELFDEKIAFMRLHVRAEEWADLATQAEILDRGDWRMLLRLAAHVRVELEKVISDLSQEIAEAQGDA